MYSLLIKDRSYPISVYMSYMMRVKDFTRTQAVELLTMAAVNTGIRESTSPPSNNTVAEWGKSIDAPQWAVISAMTLLETFGKIPFTDQEWAFWAYAAAERGYDIRNYKGKWGEWLNRAERFKSCYDQRGSLRKEFDNMTSPNTATKIILLYRGNEVKSLTLPEIFSSLDVSVMTIQVLGERMAAGQSFSKDDMTKVIDSNEQSKSLYEDISLTIHELELNKVVYHRSKGNIAIEENYH